MRLKRLPIFIFLFVILGQISAQQAVKTLAKSEYAFYTYLKDSAALVIRIEDFKDAIEKSEQRGKTWLVKDLEQKAKTEKDFTINSFTDYYDFSKFYFYNSSDAEKLIIEGDLSVIYDKDGNPVNLQSVEDIILGHNLRSENRLKFYYRAMRFYSIVNNRINEFDDSFGKELNRNIISDFFDGSRKMNDIQWINNRFHDKYDTLKQLENRS
jgi:hypothetical protein